MSFDNISDDSSPETTGNGQKNAISPESTGRHSRNSKRSRERSPRHRKAERGTKKKRRDRSISPRRRSRSKSADRQRGRNHRDRSRDRNNDRRRDDKNKRDRKSNRRDRSRDRGTRKQSDRRRRRKTSTSSSDEDLSRMQRTTTLSDLFEKPEEEKKRDASKSSKRKRKESTSSTSSSEDTRDSKQANSNGGIPQPAQPPHFSAHNQFATSEPMPPPAMNSYIVHPTMTSANFNSFLMPPPPPPPIGQPMMVPAGFMPPPQPPPMNHSHAIPVPPLPPPLPPPPQPPVAAARNSRPSGSNSSTRFSRPVVLNKKPRDVDNTGDWGSGSVQKYNILGQVGEGTYGQVYKAKNYKDVPFALKKVRLDNEREGFPITAVREIKILRQLNHPNVVRLVDIVTDQKSASDLRSNNANFYLVFEYVDHDLTGLLEAAHNKLIPDFSANQIAVMFKQLLSGLEYCHSKQFLHRDIKCSNILVNNRGQLKIADWGLARLYQEDSNRLYTNRVITLWYRPPELLLGAEQYGPSVDVWSVGCILAEFFTKKALFPGQHEAEQLVLISNTCGTPTPEVWPSVVDLPLYRTMKPKKTEFRRLKEAHAKFVFKWFCKWIFSILPPPALDLLDKMLILDPKKRISATDALKHNWIKHLDISRVQPLELPFGQDCHELWSKKQKKDRKSGIATVGHLQTVAVPVNQPTTSMQANSSQRQPDSSDGKVTEFFQVFNALVNGPDVSKLDQAKNLISTISEANCQAILQELAANKIAIPNGYFNNMREKLIVVTANTFGIPYAQHLPPQPNNLQHFQHNFGQQLPFQPMAQQPMAQPHPLSQPLAQLPPQQQRRMKY